MSRRLVAALTVAIAAPMLTGCSQGSEPSSSPSEDPHLVGHVHGLGVDPDDGSLYAAGHFGLFRVDGKGVPTRVADRWQDTMAFTVTGPRTFLASGHPDLREDLPPALGLIESTDAGETWEALSLQGEADFHTLDVAGELIYGYDASSGRLMSTTDRAAWKTVTQGQFVDVAATGDRLLVTTPTAAVRAIAADGSSSPLQGAPSLMWIDATPSGEIIGINAKGAVYMEAPGGAWTRAGQVSGSPTAFEATDTAWYVATDQDIYSTTDGGKTWKAVLGG